MEVGGRILAPCILICDQKSSYIIGFQLNFQKKTPSDYLQKLWKSQLKTFSLNAKQLIQQLIEFSQGMNLKFQTSTRCYKGS